MKHALRVIDGVGAKSEFKTLTRELRAEGECRDEGLVFVIEATALKVALVPGQELGNFFHVKASESVETTSK